MVTVGELRPGDVELARHPDVDRLEPGVQHVQAGARHRPSDRHRGPADEHRRSTRPCGSGRRRGVCPRGRCRRGACWDGGRCRRGARLGGAELPAGDQHGRLGRPVDVRHRHAGQLVPPGGQVGGQHLPAGDDPAQAADPAPVAGHLGVLQVRRQRRGHERERGDPLVMDELGEVARVAMAVRTRQHHGGTGAQRPEDLHDGGVEARGGLLEHPVVPAEGERALQGRDQAEDGAVADHDALGPPGRPGRVDQIGGMVRSRRGRAGVPGPSDVSFRGLRRQRLGRRQRLRQRQRLGRPQGGG